MRSFLYRARGIWLQKTEKEMQAISPVAVLQQIASAVPADCRKNIIIIGSLAVGFFFFQDRDRMVVRTKDADCLLSPRVRAIQAGIAIAERLLEAGWKFKKIGNRTEPGTASTPEADLPAVRLCPPGETEWFIELFTVPESPKHRDQKWVRLKTKHGHFGLCSFGFLSLTNYKPIKTNFGIFIARPEMMALANLLEHPIIGPETMARGFAGRSEIKRSNKDLGRVLAIARLAIGRDEDALLVWPELWRKALQDRFPEDWRKLAGRVGNGLRALLASEPDLEQAWHTCVNGLLASDSPALNLLRIAGARLLQDAVVPLEKEAALGG